MFISRRGGKDVEHPPYKPDTPRRKSLRTVLGYLVGVVLYAALMYLADYTPFTKSAFFHWVAVITGGLLLPFFLLFAWVDAKRSPKKDLLSTVFEALPLLLILAGVIMNGLSYWFGTGWEIAGYACMVTGFLLLAVGLLYMRSKRSNIK